MQHVQSEIISIADACLGGLRGRSALLIGPEETRHLYKKLLQEAGTKTVFQETDYTRVSTLLPQVQLLMNMPDSSSPSPLLPAAAIAAGCTGRRTPLLIFDLALSTSVEEMAGLLPAVCLYTPSDLRHVLQISPPDTCVHA
jgi:glutamyl-tRNA reductase